MTFEEYFKKHRELVDKLDSIRKEMKEFEKTCSVQDIQEGQLILNESKNCDEWNKLLVQEIEIIEQLNSLNENYWGSK